MKKRVFMLLLCASCLCGCSKQEQPQKKEAAQKEAACDIVWAMESDEAIPEKNVEACNALLQKKGYNMRISFTYLEGDLTGEKPELYRESLRSMIKQEKIDIAFTGWEYETAPGGCAKFMREGCCSDLDEWLKTSEGKKIYALYDKEIWDTCRVDGKVKAFPNERHLYAPATVVGFNKAYFTEQEAKQWDGSWEELLQMMNKKKLPDNVYMIKGFPEISRFLQTDSGKNYLLQDKLVYETDSEKIYSLFDTKAFHEYLSFLHQCFEKGYLFDVSMGSFQYEDEVYESMEQGNYAVDISADSNENREAVIYAEAPNYMVENNLGGKTIVADNAPHREEALHLISALRTDAELANALLYGKEGEDYTRNVQGRVESNEGPAGEWSLGLADEIFSTVQSPYGDFRKYKSKLLKSDKRISSGLAGFYPDYTAVEKEKTQYLKLVKKYENCWKSKAFEEKYREGQEKINKQIKPLLREIQKQRKQWRENCE